MINRLLQFSKPTKLKILFNTHPFNLQLYSPELRLQCFNELKKNYKIFLSNLYKNFFFFPGLSANKSNKTNNIPANALSLNKPLGEN